MSRAADPELMDVCDDCVAAGGVGRNMGSAAGDDEKEMPGTAAVEDAGASQAE
jgi:hypothetical protein